MEHSGRLARRVAVVAGCACLLGLAVTAVALGSTRPGGLRLFERAAPLLLCMAVAVALAVVGLGDLLVQVIPRASEANGGCEPTGPCGQGEPSVRQQ